MKTKIKDTLRPFTKQDDRVFCSTKKPSDGSTPLIGRVKITNWPDSDKTDGWDDFVTVIVDGLGVCLCGTDGVLTRAIPDFEDAKAIAYYILSTPTDYIQLVNSGKWESINL